jgi:hypothetical protein
LSETSGTRRSEFQVKMNQLSSTVGSTSSMERFCATTRRNSSAPLPRCFQIVVDASTSQFDDEDVLVCVPCAKHLKRLHKSWKALCPLCNRLCNLVNFRDHPTRSSIKWCMAMMSSRGSSRIACPTPPHRTGGKYERTPGAPRDTKWEDFCSKEACTCDLLHRSDMNTAEMIRGVNGEELVDLLQGSRARSAVGRCTL